MTYLDEPYTPQTYTPEQLDEIHAINIADMSEEMTEASRILEEHDYDQKTLQTTDILQDTSCEQVSRYTPKNYCYTVKFQVIKLYSIDVSATNSGDADTKAMEAFKQYPQGLKLVNTSIGHTTIEQLQRGA